MAFNGSPYTTQFKFQSSTVPHHTFNSGDKTYSLSVALIFVYELTYYISIAALLGFIIKIICIFMLHSNDVLG